MLHSVGLSIAGQRVDAASLTAPGALAELQSVRATHSHEDHFVVFVSGASTVAPNSRTLFVVDSGVDLSVVHGQQDFSIVVL